MRPRSGLRGVFGFLFFSFAAAAGPPAEAGPSSKVWSQVGNGILSTDFGEAKDAHHQSGRLVQVAWHADVYQANKKVLWAGAALGGLWKSTVDASGKVTSWVPLTDHAVLPHGMGSFLIHRTSSKKILIGPGGLASSSGNGDGNVYRTKDQGVTWKAVALPTGKNETIVKRVNRLVEDSSDATGNTVLAATSRGIFRTTDFGLSWTRVFQGVATGETDEVTDLVQDTGTPATWYAGALIDHAILRSQTSGTTGSWKKRFGTTKIGKHVGRISLAATAADPNVLYALVVNDGTVATNANGIQALYRSLDRGANWDVIFDDHDAVDWKDQGFHTCAVAADPADAAHVYFGMQSPSESTNATEPNPADVDWSPTDASTGRSTLDGGHNDFNFILFRKGMKKMVLANDGGYYLYDPTTGKLDDSGNLKGLNNTWLHDAQGDLAAGRDRPEIFIAGTQDNGLLRANAEVGIIELMEPGDGGMVSIKPADAAFMAASGTIFEEEGGNRSFSDDFGIAFHDIEMGLDDDKFSPMLIDPTPGLSDPLVFTATQPPAGIFTTVEYKPLDQTTPWAAASGWSFPGEASNLDHTTEPALHQLLLTLKDSRKLYVLTDVRAHLGLLPFFDQTPPSLPATTNGTDDAHGNADRSDLKPQTIYYTTAKSRPSRAYKSDDGGQHWTDVTGDMPTGTSGPDFNKLIGNPKNALQLFLATTQGVWRSDTAGVHWFKYEDGMRVSEEVQDIVINAHNVNPPTLFAATKGRGFWWREVD
jgi:hypothetical protein